MLSKRKLRIERAKQIIKLYDEELYTFDEIGEQFKITAGRVHQIYWEAKNGQTKEKLDKR